MQNKIEEIKLSQWAKENNKSYKQAWSMVKEGTFPEKTTETKSGRIVVIRESKASKQEIKFATPLFADFQESVASSTRKNRAAIITPTNQYQHIEEGLDIYNGGQRGDKSNDCIDVSEAIRLVRKCYYNFSDLRNIMDIIVEFSTSDIHWKGGTSKSRKFQEALWNKIDLLDLQEKFYMEYNRSCNVFPYRFESIIKDEDIEKLNKTYGIQAAKKIKLPVKYVIIDPSSVIVGGNISFANPLFYQRLNSYEVQRLVKPVTQDDKDFLASLPEEVIKQLDKKSGISSQQIDIPLSPEYVYFIFNKKADYESLASPIAFPVLKDINAKQELKNMDMATARTTMRAVLHIAMGFEGKDGEIHIDDKAMGAMQALFQSESIGKVLVTDFATKVAWVIPDISKLLSPEKYKQLNDDIRNGLNNVLLGAQDEKFANQSIKVKLFIQRLQQSREVFLKKFLIKEVKRTHELMGFKGKPPTPYYTDFDFNDRDLWNRVVVQLMQMGALTSWEANQAIEEGTLPEKEISIENQREFKKLKDEGLFQTPQNNPSTQLEVLSETNKQQVKMLEKTQEHDDKQAQKQRTHEVNHPKAEPPQIHINAPGIKGPNGRPAGSRGTPKTQKKPAKPSKASAEQYSLSKIKENLILASELNKNIKSLVCKKLNLKELNPEQSSLTDSLLESILASEPSENWKDKKVIEKYIKNPDLINEERYSEVRGIAQEHALDDYLSSILYNSKNESYINEPNEQSEEQAN